MLKKWLIVFILNAFVLQACQRDARPSSSHEEVTQQALDLMQEGRNDEAIALLKKEQSQRPAERTKILLASAYANRAGIKVDSYWGFLVGYDSLVKNSKLFGETPKELSLDESITTLPLEVRKSIQDFDKNLRNLYLLRQRLVQIPIINETQQIDLLLAVEALEDTQTPGARLYRGILELILLRTPAENGYQLFMQVAQNPKVKCLENLAQATDWIQHSNSLFQDLLQDVLIAFPSQQTEIEKLQIQSQDLLKNMADGNKKVQGLLCKK